MISHPTLYVVNNPDDMRRIPASPGVYIAYTEYGECLYVGESLNLRNRVRFGRTEFGGALGSRVAKYIALIFCDGMDTKRYEKYWIGLLAPLNNKEIRMRQKMTAKTHRQNGLYEIAPHTNKKGWRLRRVR